MHRTCFQISVAVVLAGTVAALTGAHSARAGAPPGTAEAQTAAVTQDAPVQYARIGVVPLRDDGDVRNGAADMTELLASRLNARFADAEFFVIDLTDAGFEHGPVLLDEAVALGAAQGCDALLDGVFGGVEIAGGTWPNAGADFPQARGRLAWRLVECQGGLLVIDGEISPKIPQVYSARIRSNSELVRRVMQDLAGAVGDALEQAALPAGTEPAAAVDSVTK